MCAPVVPSPSPTSVLAAPAAARRLRAAAQPWLAGALALLLAGPLAPTAARADWWATSTWQYRERLWGPRGLTGQTRDVPIRGALVEVVDAGSDSVLAWGSTDDGGRCSVLVPDDRIRSVYERLSCRTGDASRYSIAVYDQGVSPSPLTLVTPVLTGHLPNQDVEIPATALATAGKGAEEFHILDCLERGLDYAAWATGQRTRQWILAYWSADSAVVPYLDPAPDTSYGYGLHLSSQTAWDELWLEGQAGVIALQWLARRGSKPAALPPSHYRTSRALLGGWGVSCALAAQRWLGSPEPSWYVSLPVAGSAGGAAASVNMDQPDRALRGAEDTLSVARLLWSLTGGSTRASLPVGASGLGLPMADSSLWSYLVRLWRNYGVLYPTTLWGVLGGSDPHTHAAVELLFADAGFQYTPDAYEPDDNKSWAAPIAADGPSMHHTLLWTAYPLRDPDEDWSAFEVEAGQAYAVETRNPGDGYSALLLVENSKGTRAFESTGRGPDDPSALVTFTADSSGTWYAGVESESYYDFGYYDLSVSRCIPTPSQAYLPDTNSNSYARPVTLAWGSDGCFYGLSRGAASKDSASGYFLRVDAAGRSTILARYPLLRGSPAELVTGEDGAFYGVSSSVSRKGSPYSPACLFRVDRGGTLKFLQCFAPNLQMPGSGVPIAPGPGGGAFIALQRSPDSLGTVGAALVLYQVDSLGQMTLLHEFGGNDLSLTSRVVPDGSGGVHLALHSTGGEINGVYHVLPSGDAEKVLGLAPYPLAHAYYTCVLSAPGGVLFVVFESPTWTRCFEVWPNGHSRQLWEVPMAQLSGLDPHGLVASDGRLYLTGEVTRSDIFSTTTAATVVADTMGDVAQIASIDANLGFPVVLVELPDHTLYGIDRGARVFQLRGLVGNPVGWVTRFAAEPGHASVMLRWTPVVFGTLSYQVERAAGGGEFTPLSNLQQSGMAEITFRDSTAVPGTSYRYRVGCRLGPAGGWNYSTVATTAPQARAFLLALPAPNPSRVTTRLSFEVPSRGRVRVEVFNVAGARVRTLLDAVLAPGPGSVTWDGNDARGQLVPSGLYFVRLSTAGQTAARKVLRLR